jgi:hypothetical protein
MRVTDAFVFNMARYYKYYLDDELDVVVKLCLHRR